MLTALQNNLQALLMTVRAETGIPGISIALSIGGQRLFASVGSIAIDNDTPLSIDARFQLGCITKLLTCMIASSLIDEGKLDKEAVIGQYLPELADTDKGMQIAIWQLMSHTSGYQGLNISDPAIGYYYTWPKFIEFLKTTPQLFKPGSVFSYEHSEHVLLGEIIQRVTGVPLSEFLWQRIFKPLGLNVGNIREDQKRPQINVIDHSFDPTSKTFAKLKPIPFGKFWGASLSDMTMTLMDQVRLAEAIAGFAPTDSATAHLPSRRAMEFVQKQVLKLPPMAGSERPEQMPAAFGVGCAAYRGWLLGHNGSARGQTCGLRFDPRLNVALAVGINSWQPFLRDRIINHVFSALRGQSLPIAQPEPLPFEPAQLVGDYIGPQGVSLRVSRQGDDIVCHLVNTAATQPLEVAMTVNQQGHLMIKSDMQHHSIGFFKNPDNDLPCAMWGLLSLSKQH